MTTSMYGSKSCCYSFGDDDSKQWVDDAVVFTRPRPGDDVFHLTGFSKPTSISLICLLLPVHPFKEHRSGTRKAKLEPITEDGDNGDGGCGERSAEFPFTAFPYWSISTCLVRTGVSQSIFLQIRVLLQSGTFTLASIGSLGAIDVLRLPDWPRHHTNIHFGARFHSHMEMCNTFLGRLHPGGEPSPRYNLVCCLLFMLLTILCCTIVQRMVRNFL